MISLKKILAFHELVLDSNKTYMCTFQDNTHDYFTNVNKLSTKLALFTQIIQFIYYFFEMIFQSL
jgi:hypothetical protein